MRTRPLDIYHLFTQWLTEVVAFILLPLVIYVIVFLALGIQKPKLIELPEWMLVSIILFGETTRKSIAYYRDILPDKEHLVFDLKINREISVGIIGIVVSCIFLALTMVAQFKSESFSLPPSYYWFQFVCFLAAIYRSLANKIYIGLKTDEGKKLALRKQLKDSSASEDESPDLYQ